MEPAEISDLTQESSHREWSTSRLHLAATLPQSIENRAIVLEARGLTKSFGGQSILAGVDLEVRQGEVVLLRGANGSGKTTLLNILTGHLEPDAGEIRLHTTARGRRFKFPSPWWAGMRRGDRFCPESVAAAAVGRTWQDIRLFQSLRLRDNIAVADPGQPGEEPWRVLLQPRAVRSWEKRLERNVRVNLEQLGLAGREDSSADRVSLGQGKRVAIARAIQSGAKILLLDEPLAGLDQAGMDEVLELLAGLALRQQVALVIIEHLANVPAVLRFASTVWTLAEGQLRAEDPAAVCATTEEAAFNDLHGWIYEMVGRKLDFQEQPLSGGALLLKTRMFPRMGGAACLEIDSLSVRRGTRWLFGGLAAGSRNCGLSLRLDAGELAILYAPNGWGKTTLLEAMAGLIPTAGGVVSWAGQEIQWLTSWERVWRGIVLLRSRGYLFPGLTVMEVLELARREDGRAALMDHLHKPVSALSGGERQRLAIACLPLEGAGVRLLDEPFSALDATRMREAWQFLAPRPDSISLIALPSRHLESKGA
jgi:branched-chain amino acid transport system ATP-binding protein